MRTLSLLSLLAVVAACTGDDEPGGQSPSTSRGESAGTAEPFTSAQDDDDGGDEGTRAGTAAATTTTELSAAELGPLGETDVEINTDDGIVQIGAAELPTSLPDGFPLPDDLVVQISSEEQADAGFSGVSQLGFEPLVELYRSGLPDAGFEVTEEEFIAGVLVVLSFTDDETSGSVVVSDAPTEGHSVIVTFGT